jgi:hypothetical protein
VFRWKVDRRGGAKAGDIAGNVNDRSGGYRFITIDCCSYKASRLAWKTTYGIDPPCEVDHRNKQKGDDRIANLRLASRQQNNANRGPNCNNTSGEPGVVWEASRGKWKAQIRIGNRHENLGRYDDFNDAVIIRRAAAEFYHNEFAGHLN